MPILKKYNEPLARLRNQTVKRTFDFIISGFVLLFILSWLVPLVGLLIKLESKGPVFFKQERSGRNNNSFVCLKFRSMRMNDQSDVMQATKNDMRITKIGAFLRKTSIDELPQFINVFRGEMSIIGPRPHMLRHTKEYNERINHYMVRLYLKPGVTGWAQANGYRGEVKELDLMKKRVEHDIWYMENWSILLDIKIMYLTFLKIIKGDDNAY
jgi:putative colanic acid biosynthesis UDP-glucose lipid carrier transferase